MAVDPLTLRTARRLKAQNNPVAPGLKPPLRLQLCETARGSAHDISRRQPIEEANKPGLVPHQIDGKEGLGGQHIRPPSAHDLVAEPTTTCLGVHGLRHAHQSSLTQPRRTVTGRATPQDQQLDFHRLRSATRRAWTHITTHQSSSFIAPEPAICAVAMELNPMSVHGAQAPDMVLFVSTRSGGGMGLERRAAPALRTSGGLGLCEFFGFAGKNRAQVLSRTEARPCQPKRASHLSSRPPGRRARRASRSSAAGRRRPEVSSAAIAVSSNTSVCTWLPPKLRNRGRRAARRPAACWLSPAMKSRSPRAPALPGSSPAPTPAHNAGLVVGRHGVDAHDHRGISHPRLSRSSM